MPVKPELQSVFDEKMDQVVRFDHKGRIALAVSGGSDSMALLHLATRWAKPRQVACHVVTVDHQLRPNSATEADWVKSQANALGLDHTTLIWQGWDGRGNTQAHARNARYELIDNWRGDIEYVLTGHTLNDQAETVLMRIKRKSGVDGLAAMSNKRVFPSGMQIVRPLLTISRDHLRDMLTQQGGTWVDDPSNENTDYDRIRMRKALPHLSEMGIGIDTLATMANQMQRAQVVLRQSAQQAFLELGAQAPTGIALRADGFWALPAETQLRILAAAIMWTSGAHFRPRLAALVEAACQVKNGKPRNLAGCIVSQRQGLVLIDREYAAIETLNVPAESGVLWDGSWAYHGETLPDHTLRPLGASGVAQLPQDIRKQHSVRRLYPQPALFFNDKLIAAPSILPQGAEKFTKVRPNFADFLLSH